MSKGPKWRRRARKDDYKHYVSKKRSRRKKAKNINGKERRERDRLMTAAYGNVGHKMCGRKHRYDSEEMATKYALITEGYCKHTISVYKCPFCHGWHLTSEAKAPRCS